MSNLSLQQIGLNKELFSSRLSHRECLTKKDDRTFLITLEFDKAPPFETGDSFAIYPHNKKQDVLEFCQLLGFNPDLKLNSSFTLHDYLTKNVSLTKWTSKLSQLFFAEGKLPEELKQLEVAAILKTLVLSQELSFKVLECLAPQMPRYYSIASSPHENPFKMDLLVSLNSFEVDGQLKYGLASSYLCKDLVDGESLSGFVHTASHFRIPEDHCPMIMIGPGTGVAPFRAFIQDRMRKKTGANWLFFGERNKISDFYFEEEFCAYADSGLLKLSLAFSRDQAHKIYVQHLIEQQQEELYSWIKNGAAIYVCGDAKNMAKDVEASLIAMLERYEGIDSKSAQLKLREWKKQKRYNLDVY